MNNMNELNQHISGFERQMRQQEGLSGITIESYCKKVEDFLQWLAKNRPATTTPPADITRQDIEAYLEHCFIIGNKNQTRLTKLIALQKFSKYLVYEGIIPEDFTARIPRPKVRKGLVQKFTQAEILGLFAVVDIHTEKGLRDIVILILGVFCGLRISEIIKLNTNDIIDKDGSVEVNIIKTKHGANRVVYLWKSPSLFVMQWLTIRLSQGAGSSDPFLVAYRKGDNPTPSRLTPVGIDKLIKKYASDANTRKPVVTMHMLRATHATDLRHIRGYDIFAIMARMGWESMSTAEIYVTTRTRIHKEYPSLASYWRDFGHVWSIKKEEMIEKQG
ncbi:MAG: tyrosine-type recombinase/integrase [Planctomycetes bacterium]|nr:tyrosine-type recombinase/integrase [Planctomycetota bacterium]